MKLSVIKKRREEIYELLSDLNSQAVNWFAKKNDAQVEVDRLLADLKRERSKKFLGKPDKVDEVSERLSQVTNDLNVANAHIEAQSPDDEEEKARSDRIKEVTQELHLLDAKESKFRGYRGSCFDVILNRVDIRLAGVFKQALEFDDAGFFFKEFEKICNARLA